MALIHRYLREIFCLTFEQHETDCLIERGRLEEQIENHRHEVGSLTAKLALTQQALVTIDTPI